MMERANAVAQARAERRAAMLRAELAEGWRDLSGVEVTESGGEVIVEGRRLRLRGAFSGFDWEEW